jgi:hypothetical protein
MSDLRLAIIAATGTARKRLIPAVRERYLCNIVCQSVRILEAITESYKTMRPIRLC